MGKGFEYDSRTESYTTPSGGELTKNSRVRAKLLNVISQVGRIVCFIAGLSSISRTSLNSKSRGCVDHSRTRLRVGKCRLDGLSWLRGYRVIGVALSFSALSPVLFF